MFYSILPVDQEMDSEVKYEEIIYKGQLILAKTVGQVQTIERLYSTNPIDYLNSQLQPGAIIENPLINRQKRCYNDF